METPNIAVLLILLIGSVSSSAKAIFIKSIKVQKPHREAVLPFRENYVLLKEHGAYYKLHSEAAAFSAAVESCRVEDAELFVPSTEQELEAVFDMVAERREDDDEARVWLGITDVFSEGFFVTVDGRRDFYMDPNMTREAPAVEGVDKKKCMFRSAQPIGNYYYHAGPQQHEYTGELIECQPLTLDGDDADCVVAARGPDAAAYAQEQCSASRGYVCKKPVASIRWNYACGTHDPNYVYDKSANGCHKLYAAKRAWGEAYEICSRDKAHLAIVNGEREAQTLVRMMAHHPANDRWGGATNEDVFLVGFSDLVAKGNYVAVDGVPIRETGYSKNEGDVDEDYVEPRYRCGMIKRNGFLSTVDCKKKAMFFCEMPVARMAEAEGSDGEGD